MNTNDQNANTENSDKTIVFNNSKHVDITDLDKTQVQQSNITGKALASDDKTVINAELISSEGKNSVNTDRVKDTISQKPESKGVSKSVLAAGIAGAGVAGVAAGTVFSEEIKGAVEAIAANFPGNGDYIPEVTEETSQGSATLTFSDATGVYEVTLTDTLGDGKIDTFDIDAQLVDGTNVQFTASGTLLDQMFNNEQIETASANDYLTNALGIFEGFTPESLNSTEYQIQYGDTLSEIAAANNTTVAHIMELNPNISDPNMIIAGNELIIPTNDNMTNPYEGWNPQWNQSSDVFLAQNETNYDTMDWASFEDQPLDDYSGYLQTESFDDYAPADSYLDVSNDLSSLDFFA
jgi:hypothetical protein